MKFSEMKYERPDFDNQYAKMKALLETMEKAESAETLFSAMEALDQEGRHFQTQAQLCDIRYTLNTRDTFYSAERNKFDEETPRFEEIPAEAARIVLTSSFREQVAAKYGEHLLEKYEVVRKAFSPEIVEDLVEENKLRSEYTTLMASAEIDFEGAKRNLSALTPFMQSTDRGMRQRANDAQWQWIASHATRLDDIYDRLVKVRTRIGKKLGHDSFIPVAYARMGRTDWNPADARVYRNQIAESVVPLTKKLYEAQSARLGIRDMKNFDYTLEFLTGNATPKGQEQYLVEQAAIMYDELSSQTREFFGVMTGQELMDLTTRDGKANGGYMTYIPDYKAPFIFSNFNGTSDDVDVLTHEAGHAFQGYVQKDVELTDLSNCTSEVAEMHSMSMEFFTHPWMERFFREDTQKYYYSHVVDALKFMPYGASIDEFQEWVYENPEATPEQRNAKYRELEKKYLPHLDYNGLEYLEKGGRWQKQLHIYVYPFYYLDYTISQVCAMQYLVWDMKDHQQAWDSYMELCKLSGRLPFRKLVPLIGLKDPFLPDTIARITPEIEKYLASLDMK